MLTNLDHSMHTKALGREVVTLMSA